MKIGINTKLHFFTKITHEKYCLSVTNRTKKLESVCNIQLVTGTNITKYTDRYYEYGN